MNVQHRICTGYISWITLICIGCMYPVTWICIGDMYGVSRICIGCGSPIHMSNTYRTSLYTYTQYILWLSNTYVQVFSKTYTYPNIYENMYWIYVLDRIYIYWAAQHMYWVYVLENICVTQYI